MSQQVFAPTIKGFMPGIDRRRVKDVFVVEGRNFLMSLNGPTSGFGRTITGEKTIYQPTNVQSFKVVETQESYICTDEGIFRFNTVSQRLDALFLLATISAVEFPWSSASVGNKVYFTKPEAGLIEYDVVNDTWQVATGGSIPSNIYACTEAEGRLIVLTDSVSAWSAIGVGQDFTPSTTTGAGSQPLTKLGISNPTPLGLEKTPDGYLTFLSSGIIKSQAIQAANPFRHTILSKEHELINPFCLAMVDAATTVFATQAGLFTTSGQQPKVYSPLMTEFLHEKIFPKLDTVNNRNSVRLYADMARAWFIVSLSMNQQDYFYDIAYTLNLRTQEWGSFNANHVAFLDLETLAPNQSGFSFSLVDYDGTLSRFDSSVGVEKTPRLLDGLYYHKVPVDAFARENAVATTFTCRMNLRSISTAAMSVSGLFNTQDAVASYVSPITRNVQEKDVTIDVVANVLYFPSNNDWAIGFEDINTRHAPTPFDPLNATITVGLFRISDELSADRLSFITNIAAHMLDVAVGTTYDDWMSVEDYPVDVTEDWLTMPELVIDWGGGPALSSNYSARVESGEDGYVADVTQDPTMLEITSRGRVKRFSCYSTGQYHTVTFEALNVGENFELKLLDTTINLGGRI